MADLFYSSALLPEGWARNVRIVVAPDGAIESVTRDADTEAGPPLEGIALPGVPNLHSHAFQRAMAGLTERGAPGGDTFWSWRTRMYAFLERVSPDDVRVVAAPLGAELLRHGFTALVEFHYLRNDPSGAPYADPTEMARGVLGGAAEAGIGVTLLPALYRTADFGGAVLRGGQRRFASGPEEILGDIAALGGAGAAGADEEVGLALHSLRAVPPDDLARVLELLGDVHPSAPVHIHVAEQRREVEACVRWSGARPVTWLLDHAPVDGRWCLVHATHMTPVETDAVARSGAVVGLCPTTEANLGDGVFPFAEYAEAGGRWGVGTDSHVSVSPVAELRTLEYGQRLTRQRRNVAAGSDGSTGRALLEGAWGGGARACGRPLGRLERGFRADVVVLDPDHPVLVGRSGDEVLDAWIFAGEDTPVRDVWVGGRAVVRGGRHVRQEAIEDAYRAVARRLARS